MKLLALDTATECYSAALLADGRLLTREVELARGHAERILPMIQELLAEAGLTLRGLDAIAFGRGPGSFTGVRLAASVTQGLAFGADLGVVAVSDLRAVAQHAFDDDASVTRAIVCNDARMQEVYWACFERDLDGLAAACGPERVGAPATVKLPPTLQGAAGFGRGFAAYPALKSLSCPGLQTWRGSPPRRWPRAGCSTPRPPCRFTCGMMSCDRRRNISAPLSLLCNILRL